MDTSPIQTIDDHGHQNKQYVADIHGMPMNDSNVYPFFDQHSLVIMGKGSITGCLFTFSSAEQ